MLRMTLLCYDWNAKEAMTLSIVSLSVTLNTFKLYEDVPFHIFMYPIVCVREIIIEYIMLSKRGGLTKPAGYLAQHDSFELAEQA